MSDLRTLRKRLGLTQAELAALLETRQPTISNQERGKVPVRRERLLAVLYMIEHPEEAQRPGCVGTGAKGTSSGRSLVHTKLG